MAVAGDIYLGALGSEVKLSPFGRKFQEGEIELSRSDRTASGKLIKEIIAIKKQFVIIYDTIGTDDLDDLIDIYELKSELNFVVYYSNSVNASYTVLMEPFDRERIVLLGGGLWGGVTIKLSEV